MKQTIYVELLNEGTDVWRPVDAELLSDGRFKILGSIPEDEEWAFSPGSVVQCRERSFADGAKGLVAYAPS